MNLAFGADVELVETKEKETKSDKFVHVPKSNVELQTLAAADAPRAGLGSESEAVTCSEVRSW